MGFHFCTNIRDCFNYYEFNPDNKITEVKTLGDIDINSTNSKCSTNKIHIVRELSWHEVLDLVNTEQKCTGFANTGNFNSGNRNSGNYNAGDGNTGDFNTGNYNSGDWNSGDFNITSFSSGSFNTDPETIRLFNKPSDWTCQKWLRSMARAILMSCLKDNIKIDDSITDESLEQKDVKYSRQEWWKM